MQLAIESLNRLWRTLLSSPRIRRSNWLRLPSFSAAALTTGDGDGKIAENTLRWAFMRLGSRLVMTFDRPGTVLATVLETAAWGLCGAGRLRWSRRPGWNAMRVLMQPGHEACAFGADDGAWRGERDRWGADRRGAQCDRAVDDRGSF